MAAEIVLTDREYDVLLLAAEGDSYLAMSIKLDIAHGTVASHAERLRLKLGARNLAQAVAEAYHRGILVPGNPNG